MKLSPCGDLRVVVSRLKVLSFLLCTVAIGHSASTGRSEIVPTRVHTVEKDDFRLPHGQELNKVRFLTDGVQTVEIPAGSLLYLPENGRIRIAKEVVGEMVDWKEFFAANPDLIRQVGVSREVLQGLREVHPEISKHLVESRKVGIAVAAGRPVALPQPS